MKKRIICLITAFVTALVMLCGCGENRVKRLSAVTENDEKLNGTYVAKIGETDISLADFNFIYKLIYDNMSQYSSYYGDSWEEMEIEEGKTMLDFIKENTMEQLKQTVAIRLLADEHDISVKDLESSVTTTKNSIVNDNYKGIDKYTEYLLSAKSTDKAFDNYLETSELYNRLYKELTKVGGEAEVKNDDIKEEFMDEYSNKWRVQHILISTTDQGSEGESEPKTEEEAKAIADEVIKKLNNGEDFGALIDEYNEDPGMSKSKYYVFGTGEMVPEFEEAAKNLEIDEYTKEPVKSDYGYHIIKRYAIDETIDEFKDFKSEKQQSAANEIIQKKIDEIDPITFNDEAIDKELAEWKEERAAATEAEKAAEQEASEDDAKEENPDEEAIVPDEEQAAVNDENK